MGIIHVNGIRIYAFHGCLPEEARVGGDYIVDVEIDTDFSSAEKTDRLEETVDYCDVYEIVKSQMAIRSKLIEHVARRILDELEEKFPKALFTIKLTKIAPPMNGDVQSVDVVLRTSRSR